MRASEPGTQAAREGMRGYLHGAARRSGWLRNLSRYSEITGPPPDVEGRIGRIIHAKPGSPDKFMSSILQKCAAPGLFRLILALLVLVNHTTPLGVGLLAVYVFFILSGFWITTMWIKRYSKTRSAYVTFLVSRIWRILPVFSLCSFLTWIILISRGAIPRFSDTIFHQVFSNAFIFGYSGLLYRPNGPAWSLDVELQFYIVAPLVIVLMTRSIWVLIACAILPVAANLINAPATVANFFIFFAVGVASASKGWRPGSKLALGSLFSTISIIVVCLISPLKVLILAGPELDAFNGMFSQILGLMLAPWAIYTTRQQGEIFDGMFGDLSFIIYMLHWPVLGFVDFKETSYLQRGIEIGEALTVIMIGSVLIWRLFDQPINKLRSKWVASRLTSNTRESNNPHLSWGSRISGLAGAAGPISAGNRSRVGNAE